MARPASQWKNPKFKHYVYVGKYERTARSQDRIFVLTRNEGRKHVVSYESHEEAKKNGWQKIS